MKTRYLFPLMALAFLFSGNFGWAQEAFKIGLILPMTGQSASTGKQIQAAAYRNIIFIVRLITHGDYFGLV
jgi:branched-chain amino acid transport system substrate-binding protein